MKKANAVATKIVFCKEQEFSLWNAYNFTRKTTLRAGIISRIAVEIGDLKKLENVVKNATDAAKIIMQ